MYANPGGRCNLIIFPFVYKLILLSNAIHWNLNAPRSNSLRNQIYQRRMEIENVTNLECVYLLTSFIVIDIY